MYRKEFNIFVSFLFEHQQNMAITKKINAMKKRREMNMKRNEHQERRRKERKRIGEEDLTGNRSKERKK